MFFSPRISTKKLVQLCHRVGNQLEAGIDERKIWADEHRRARGSARRLLYYLSESIERGNSLKDALKTTGDYFPEVFREMVGLGVETGHLDVIMKQLAEQYEHSMQLRRTFLAGIAWPMLQLFASIIIIGILIFAMGVVSEMTGQKIDVLGLGLFGGSGVLIYLAFIVAIGVGLTLFYQIVSRGFFRFLQLGALILHVPLIGTALKTIALSKMSWVLSLTYAGGMEVRRALRLALNATHNQFFIRHADQIDKELLEGGELHWVLRETHAFPDEFLDAIEAGEISGKITESMSVIAKQYQAQAKQALNYIAILGGLLVWALVGVILIALIFKIFSFYYGIINEVSTW
ncbi:MAG: hypothetical protein COA78_20955 [Blastopirellula sp.]|nr:MAG: hypothetical protein COA78_20955 [Blastopirellula sp.]